MNDFKQQWLRRTSAARKAPDPNAILRTCGPGALRAAMDEAKVIELHPDEYRFTDDQLRSAGAGATNPEVAPTLRPLDIYDFCKLAIPKREMVLGPVVPEKGLVMLYAARGTGKTFVGLGAGYAVAGGGTFFFEMAGTETPQGTADRRRDAGPGVAG